MDQKQYALIQLISKLTIGPAQKTGLYLMALGKTVGTMVKIFPGSQPAISVIKELWLPCAVHTVPEYRDEQSQEDCVIVGMREHNIAISDLAMTLGKNARSARTKDSVKRFCLRRIAETFRYPESVIRGIENNDLIDESMYDPEMNDLKKMGILRFPLSRERFAEELLVAKQWKEELEQYVPEFMAEFAEMHHA